jgi:outer membrane protein OmpA-like peptidoglycan-associated protein
MKTLIPLIFLAAACSYRPSAELVRAQEAYRQAANGVTSDVAPAELHMAKASLDVAARADYADPGSDDAKDLAYVAERKAEWAQAQAATKIALRDKTAAERRLVAEQGNLISEKEQALSQKDQAISEREQAISQRDRDLVAAKQSTEQAQALAAEAAAREQAAMAKLKAAEESRGLVVTMSASTMFQSNKSVLLPAAMPKLDEVVNAMQKMPSKTLLIEGHTDAIGSEEKNLELSSRRAKAVKDYLVSKGIAEDRIKTQGVGKSRPIADNGTSDGRAMNRRVEIIFQNSTDSTAHQ